MKRGIAYAFLDRNIEPELPTLRSMTQTPNDLEISVIEGVKNLPTQGDPALKIIVKRAQDAGMNYVLQARYSGVIGKKTVGELATVVNQAYQSPLYQKDAPFRGELVFPSGKGYTLAA